MSTAPHYNSVRACYLHREPMTFEHVVAYAESLKEVGFRITKLDPPRWVDMSWRVGTRTIDAV